MVGLKSAVAKFKTKEEKKIKDFIDATLEDNELNNIIITPLDDQNEVLVTIIYQEPQVERISNDLYAKALEYMYEENNIGINFLQVKLGIGFNRASILIHELEDLGIVSKKENNQRSLLVSKEEAYKLLLLK